MEKIVIKITGETSGDEIIYFFEEVYEKLNVDFDSLLKITIEKVSEKEYNKDSTLTTIS